MNAMLRYYHFHGKGRAKALARFGDLLWFSPTPPASRHHLHSQNTHTSLPGLRLRQFGWNLLTWRTWMAHLMLR